MSEVRSRCVLKDFATTDDVFAPTPSPLSVRGLLLHAAWFIVIMKSDREEISIIQYCIMRASHSKVPIDHGRNVSSPRETVLFLSFLFLEADLLLEEGILHGFVQSRGNPRVQHLLVLKIFSMN